MTTNYEKLDTSEDVPNELSYKRTAIRVFRCSIVLFVICLCVMTITTAITVYHSLRRSCIAIRCHPFVIGDSCAALYSGDLLMMIEGNCSSLVNTTDTCYIDHINLFGNKEDPKIVGRLQCVPNYWIWLTPIFNVVGLIFILLLVCINVYKQRHIMQ